MSALYLTAWIGVALFVAGDMGRSLHRRGAPPPAWAWWTFIAGFVVTLVHTAISFDIVHAWSHDDAVLNTAMQTEAVFGVRVGSGLYVNYVFLAAWLADAIWWRLRPDAIRPAGVTWPLRIFYFVILANAAVIFAVGWRRLPGTVLIAALAFAWGRADGATRVPPSPRR